MSQVQKGENQVITLTKRYTDQIIQHFNEVGGISLRKQINKIVPWLVKGLFCQNVCDVRMNGMT